MQQELPKWPVVKLISQTKKGNKAIGDMKSYPLPVGSLYTAFHSKDFHLWKKQTPLLHEIQLLLIWLLDHTKKPSNGGKHS